MLELSPEVLAYTAGLFDGEGSICLKRPGNAYLSINVANTDEDIILWLQLVYGGHIYKYPGLMRNRKDAWKWSLSSSNAANFLSLILPYLRIKKERAELAILFQSHKRVGKSGENSPWNPLSEEERAVQTAMAITMAALNGRGKTGR